jgi:hypothetical protein
MSIAIEAGFKDVNSLYAKKCKGIQGVDTNGWATKGMVALVLVFGYDGRAVDTIDHQTNDPRTTLVVGGWFWLWYPTAVWFLVMVFWEGYHRAEGYGQSGCSLERAAPEVVCADHRGGGQEAPRIL